MQPDQIERGIEIYINKTISDLCGRSLDTSLSNGSSINSKILWSWGWKIQINWKYSEVGYRYNFGGNDKYIDSFSGTKNYVQNLSNDYQNNRHNYFYNKLRSSIGTNELNNFAIGDIYLGSDGNYYISKDNCSSCNGHGNINCYSCYGTGKTTCHHCHGKGLVSELFDFNHPSKGYINKNCAYCIYGKVTCGHCINGSIQCIQCKGSGDVFHSFSITGFAKKVVFWNWFTDNIFHWLPNFIQKNIDNGNANAMVPYLQNCIPTPRTSPLDGCSYSFSMDSTIFTAEFDARNNFCSTKISVAGPQFTIVNAGGLLDGFIEETSTKINSKRLVEKRAALHTPIIDKLLSAFDNKDSHFTLQQNFVSSSQYKKLTDRYNGLVAEIQSIRHLAFTKEFIKKFTTYAIIISCICIATLISFPRFSFYPGYINLISTQPSIFFDVPRNLFKSLFLHSWTRCFISLIVTSTIASLVQKKHWCKISYLGALFYSLLYITTGYIYTTEIYKTALEILSSTNKIGKIWPNIYSIFEIWKDISITVCLAEYIVSKYRSWRSTDIKALEIGSPTLSKRLKIN